MLSEAEAKRVAAMLHEAGSAADGCVVPPEVARELRKLPAAAGPARLFTAGPAPGPAVWSNLFGSPK